MALSNGLHSLHDNHLRSFNLESTCPTWNCSLSILIGLQFWLSLYIVNMLKVAITLGKKNQVKVIKYCYLYLEKQSMQLVQCSSVDLIILSELFFFRCAIQSLYRTREEKKSCGQRWRQISKVIRIILCFLVNFRVGSKEEWIFSGAPFHSVCLLGQWVSISAGTLQLNNRRLMGCL